MEFDEIVVKESPGLCRCCLSEGCYKDLATEYSWMDDTEVYAEMLLECFDISISQHNDGPNGPNRLICEVCITRLRDACNFKKQVLASEKKFVDMIGRGAFKPKVVLYPSPIKAEVNVEHQQQPVEPEVEYLEEEIDFGDVSDELIKEGDSDQMTISEDITVATLPVKGKRGRPRKNAVVKTNKKIKLAKTDEKPKTSKAVTKDEPSFNPMLLIDDRLAEKRRKDELAKLLAIILEYSTIMPFRWCGNKYMCFYCCRDFIDSLKLKQHTREEHKGAKLRKLIRSIVGQTRIKLDISEIACIKCPKAMETLEDFLIHVADGHDMWVDREISRDLLCFRLSDEGMSCIDCGAQFRFFGPLLAHVHKYHNKASTFLCEICGQGFVAKANVDSHVKNVHSNTSSHCDKCDKTFSSNYALSNHYMKVHRSDKLRCPKCPEILASRYLKKRHLALVHDVKSSQFACELCSKVFTTKSALVQHTSRVHLKEKSVGCEICGFKVFSKELLKRHMVKHDDTRPYQCEYCKKSFQRKKTLEYHRRIHTNDKRYACSECGKAFVQVTSLKLHLRVHHSIAKEGSQ
ncbi:zinc finger protein 420-like isoform X6 [Battus philenor]|uniref:zinc finger protein 420-like isoform X6 n=1 Tax=Battus philenor TaxID=42288 RepID=UPI0035D06F85